MARMAKLVAPLHTGGVPRRHVVLDTEAGVKLRHGQHEQSWALGVAAFLDRNGHGEMFTKHTVSYTDPSRLWADIIAYTRPRSRTVVWSHNLGYDLRISRALERLPAEGFKLQGIVLERTSSWAAFTKDGATIMCCDLFSWLPASLEAIGNDLAMGGHLHEIQGATTEQLADRCAHDVAVTAEAVKVLLQFVLRENLGPWRPTGAGQSIAAWRTRWLTIPPLVHDDLVALEAERRSMWTGRCEAWRWGDLSRAGAVEYDLKAAYCNIAAECDVPVRLMSKVGAIGVADYQRMRRRFAIMAEVEVITHHPVVPAAMGDRIHWPVGTFETILWDPELDRLLEAGATVRFKRAWLYHRAPALAEMAKWVLERIGPNGAQVSHLERRLLKHWSRAIVGRQALRYRSWDEFGTSPTFDLSLGVMFDLDAGTETDMLQIGHDILTLGELAEADSSVPQITAWVMSEARSRLWQLMRAAGLDEVLYVDTDSVITTAAGAQVLDQLIADGGAFSLARKAPLKGLVIHGPRNLEHGKERRLAGVPAKAKRTAPLEFDGEIWRSLKESMTRGELTTVVVTPRSFRAKITDYRRTHLANGATAPHREVAQHG